MGYVSSDERLIWLANELQKVLNDCVNDFSVSTDAQMERAFRLKREIIMMGAIWECQYLVEDGQIDAIVTIYKVKENLSPENQKIYDEWFSKVNGIKI